jgi:hypothetical protein
VTHRIVAALVVCAARGVAFRALGTPGWPEANRRCAHIERWYWVRHMGGADVPGWFANLFAQQATAIADYTAWWLDGIK